MWTVLPTGEWMRWTVMGKGRARGSESEVAGSDMLGGACRGGAGAGCRARGRVELCERCDRVGRGARRAGRGEQSQTWISSWVRRRRGRRTAASSPSDQPPYQLDCTSGQPTSTHRTPPLDCAAPRSDPPPPPPPPHLQLERSPPLRPTTMSMRGRLASPFLAIAVGVGSGIWIFSASPFPSPSRSPADPSPLASLQNPCSSRTRSASRSPASARLVLADPRAPTARPTARSAPRTTRTRRPSLRSRARTSSRARPRTARTSSRRRRRRSRSTSPCARSERGRARGARWRNVLCVRLSPPPPLLACSPADAPLVAKQCSTRPCMRIVTATRQLWP